MWMCGCECQTVYRHFGPRTVRTQDNSAPLHLCQIRSLSVNVMDRVRVRFRFRVRIRLGSARQGCPQDVRSQDRDETERSIFSNSQDPDVEPSRPRWDRDVPFSQTLKTETKRDVQPSRPRRSKKRIETAVSQFKNTNWWSLSLDNLFLAGQIHYFLRDISASLMDCMDVHKTKVTRPRPRRYIFKTETRPRR